MKRLVFLSLMLVAVSFVSSVSALNYGEGTYGSCQYSSCSITVTSNGSVSLDLPFLGSSQTCSVDKDTVSVTTLSSTGYSLYISSSSSDTKLNGAAHGDDIPATSAPAGSPSALTYSSWGYRIDAGLFGAGPTSAQTGGATPSVTFAGMPALASPDYVTGSAAPANPAVTDVWYGVCVDANIITDDYANSVTYSAIIN